MTRIYLCLFALMIALAPFTAQAQEEAVVKATDKDSVAVDGKGVSLPADYEERLKHARKMHEIWPIRLKVEQAIELVSRRVAERNRSAFKAEMRKVIEFDALEKVSVDAMAEIYTADELKAMVAFYGSKEGRSITHKNADYEDALKPALTKMLDKGLLDTKLGR